MEAILIDYSTVIDKTLHKNLLKKLPSCPKNKKGFVPGLVLVIPKEIKKKLENLPVGKERVKYLGKEEFIRSITTTYYVMYNNKREICILDKNSKFFDTMLKDFSDKTVVWVCIPFSDPNFSDKMKEMVKSGFSHPYISRIDPMREETEEGICLSRTVHSDTVGDTFSESSTLNKIKHLIEEHKKGVGCSLLVQFSKETIDFLHKSPRSLGIVIGKNGKKSQKEITSELTVKDVIEKGGKFIYVIGVNEGSVESGEDEEIEVSATRYNMHSHPKEAYERHGVKKAWPSSTDYKGYLSLGEHTIFHAVATLEGVYIISLSPYWGQRLKEIKKSTDFIDKHYDIDYEEKYSPKKYVEKVNGILYEGHPIFEVKFFTWKDAGTVFKISFPRIGDACLVTQKILETYRKMSSEE